MSNEIVTLLIVVRNERYFILKSLRSFLIQTFPKSKLEIIIIDGNSRDGTREILREESSKLESQGFLVKLLDNENEILASGWNIGIRAAKGDYICRIDAHSEIDENYIDEGVRFLQSNNHPNVACVGGVITENKGDSAMSNIIADLFSSKFGIGNSPFRSGKKVISESDTAVFAVYRKEVFMRVGLFNESLKRNQDIEFHERLREGGYKLFTNPDMKIRYYVRNSLNKLLKKGYQDGLWVIYSGKSHLRHRVPLYFILYLVTSFFTVLLLSFQLILLPAILYLCLSVVFSIKDGKSLASKCTLWTVFFLYHLSYGTGSVIGLLKRLRGLKK